MKSINTNRAILILFIVAFLSGIAMPVKAEVVPASISLSASYSVDIDTGLVGNLFDSRDLFYENFDGTKRYLEPQNGAMFANLGIVSFDTITDASAYKLSSRPINASLSNNSIPVGTVLIVKTNMGNYAKMRIDAYPDPINFTVMPVTGGVGTTYISLGGSETIDIDTGAMGGVSTSRDLYYENVDGTERYLVPWNGALFANLGIVNFDSIINVSAYTLSSNPINASLNNNSIPVGTVLIVKTNMGNYAKMRIDAYTDPIDFTMVYQNNGSPIIPELSSVAIVALFLPATLVVTMAYRKKHRFLTV